MGFAGPFSHYNNPDDKVGEIAIDKTCKNLDHWIKGKLTVRQVRVINHALTTWNKGNK